MIISWKARNIRIKSFIIHLWFCLPFLWSMLPSLRRKSLIMRRREKKIWNWATKSPCWRHTIVSGAVGHGCCPLYLWWNWENISTIWEKQKQIKRETGLGFALPCTRSVLILFYFIVGLLLFIYLFFFSLAFYEQRFRYHPNFPGVPPGVAGRVQW